MLRPNRKDDRQDYRGLLTLSDDINGDFELERAIATTYSLDLATLISTAIILGFNDDPDQKMLKDNVALLHSFNNIANKLLVFHEDGQISVPNDIGPLKCFLEKITIPITLKKTTRNQHGYPAFHPKTWLLQYKNKEGERRYKFVVLSRNLTFDRSWDVCIAFESHKKRQIAKTRPIQSFLTFLSKQIPDTIPNASNKRKFIRDLNNDLDTVSFSLDSDIFDESFTIMPLGIGDGGYSIEKDQLFSKPFSELLVMSPFFSKKVIRDFNNEDKSLSGCHRVLITRKHEAESKLIPEDCSNFDIYTLKDEVIDGEFERSEDTTDGRDPLTQDIHAKIYLWRNGRNVSLYAGSMNASSSAMTDNIEMLVRMDTTKYKVINQKNLLDDIFCRDDETSGNLFEKLELTDSIPENKEEDISHELESMIKEFCRASKSASITKNENGQYTITVEVSDFNPDCQIHLAPLGTNKQQPFTKHMTFENIGILDLTEFYLISAAKMDMTVKRVIRIASKGFPDDREDQIVRSVIKDEDSFVRSILMALGDDYYQASFERGNASNASSNGLTAPMFPGLYEKMLRTALDKPQRFEELAYLMKPLEHDDDLQQELQNTWQGFSAVYQAVLKALAGHR